MKFSSVRKPPATPSGFGNHKMREMEMEVKVDHKNSPVLRSGQRDEQSWEFVTKAINEPGGPRRWPPRFRCFSSVLYFPPLDHFESWV